MSDDLERRVEQLEQEVEALHDRLDELANDPPTERVGGAIDQYDATVLQKIEDLGRAPTPRQIAHFYQEAGIRDTSKIKQRHKFLKRSGRIDDAIENTLEETRS